MIPSAIEEHPAQIMWSAEESLPIIDNSIVTREADIE